MLSGCVWLARSSRLTSPCRWQCAGPHGTFCQPKKRGVDSSWAVPFGLPKDDLAQPVAMPNGSKVPGSGVTFHLGFPVNCREAEELGLMSFWPTFFDLKAVVACGVRRFRGAVVECPNCRAVAPEETKSCQECGSPLPRSCPSCDSANRAGAKFFALNADLFGHRSAQITTHYSAAELARLVAAANRVCGRSTRQVELVVLRGAIPIESRKTPASAKDGGCGNLPSP